MNQRVIESYKDWYKRCFDDLNSLFKDYMEETYSAEERASISLEGLASRRVQFCRYMYTQCDTRIPS